MKSNKCFLRFFTGVLIFLIYTGCNSEDTTKKVKLDPKNPVTITVWHYYNGAIMNAFEAMLGDFNETLGVEKGIIVEGYGLGHVAELEKAVMASARKEVGSMEMPNIFASYADTAYEAEILNILADLGDYFSAAEQAEYLDSYIEEGKIGLNGELRIFPVAKSTEIFMVNDTDWKPFAEANGLSYDKLRTLEGLAEAAELYYNWTDGQTPDIPNDGKAFYGRDSMANFFIIAVKEFGKEIFQVENGRASINADRDVMRKIWDCYYVPYISGCFSSYGRYRSDDAKVGDIIAYVGATSSAAYFPASVISSGRTYPIEAKVLPVPHFSGGQRVMVQQGAGMVVTRNTPEEEYASVEFLKWFTDVEKNSVFAALSGYMPVKKEAMDYDTFISILSENNQPLGRITNETLKIALEEIKTSELYTSKAFRGGAAARLVLENSLQKKAVADREEVLSLIKGGLSRKEALARFNTEEAFAAWYEEFTEALMQAAG